MRVAIIPARGGSKRIPRKNIKDFCGKPMIAWSIEAAKASRCFDRIIVTTDDNEIADVANQFGAEIPFIRPKALSDDFAGTLPVVIHAIESLELETTELSEICCLYATAPFVTPDDIKRGYDALRSSRSEYAIGVTSFPFPIQRALKINDHNKVSMVNPSAFSVRSQDLEEVFHDAGQFYWGTRRAWLSGIPSFLADTVPVVLPRHRVQDIDTPEDWQRAEWLFKAMVSDDS
jgi:N-acylneuraminate cytidylyltransferase